MNRTQLLLSKLAEECSEVAQIAIKTSLFGMDDKAQAWISQIVNASTQNLTTLWPSSTC